MSVNFITNKRWIFKTVALSNLKIAHCGFTGFTATCLLKYCWYSTATTIHFQIRQSAVERRLLNDTIAYNHLILTQCGEVFWQYMDTFLKSYLDKNTFCLKKKSNFDSIIFQFNLLYGSFSLFMIIQVIGLMKSFA